VALRQIVLYGVAPVVMGSEVKWLVNDEPISLHTVNYVRIAIAHKAKVIAAHRA
jgi:hypothetical protein